MIKHRKKLLRREMIKESFDSLPTGLAFFNKDGIAVLINQRMRRLVYRIVGRDIQMVSDMELLESELLTDNLYMDLAERVWHFKKDTIVVEGEEFTRYVASDVTDITRKQEELKSSNEKLKELNEHVRAVSDNLQDIIRQEETLAMKIRVHDDLGRSIMEARRCFTEGVGAKELRERAVDWEKMVHYLDYMNQKSELTDVVQESREKADRLGVTIVYSGTWIEEEKGQRLIATVIDECVVNAARHSRADQVLVHIEKDECIRVTITSNGQMDEAKASPSCGEEIKGGGLMNLIRQVKSAGGEMKVYPDEGYRVEVILERGQND